MSETFKVCTNSNCEKHLDIVFTRWYFCPFCNQRLETTHIENDEKRTESDSTSGDLTGTP